MAWQPSPDTTVCHLLQLEASFGMTSAGGVAIVLMVEVDVDVVEVVEVGTAVEFLSTHICLNPSLESAFQTPVSQSLPIQGLSEVTVVTETLKRDENIVQLKAPRASKPATLI
jgi:hypothetical protein